MRRFQRSGISSRVLYQGVREIRAHRQYLKMVFCWYIVLTVCRSQIKFAALGFGRKAARNIDPRANSRGRSNSVQIETSKAWYILRVPVEHGRVLCFCSPTQKGGDEKNELTTRFACRFHARRCTNSTRALLRPRGVVGATRTPVGVEHGSECAPSHLALCQTRQDRLLAIESRDMV